MATFKNTDYIPQSKLLRMFQLIRLMHKLENGVSIKQISDLLDCSDRTSYRYLHFLDETGFLLDKDFNNKYFLFKLKSCPFCNLETL